MTPSPRPNRSTSPRQNSWRSSICANPSAARSIETTSSGGSSSGRGRKTTHFARPRVSETFNRFLLYMNSASARAVSTSL
ncbi:MAG TPA: hypothetical protein PLP90_02215, partial [Methanoculleus sp.]|nr:hypothetical protein [Methanoculleus sp.]